MAYDYCKLSDLKNRARRIAREERLPRHAALDEAARRGGFQNYIHAHRHLPCDFVESTRTRVEIIQHWLVRQPRQRGSAHCQITLGSPLIDLVKPQHLVDNLGGSKLDGGNVVLSNGWMRDADESVSDVGKVARTLQFMDATNLRPSRARRCYPKGDWDNRPPIADHDSCWFDPSAKVHVLSTEPYPGRADWRDREQKAWAAKHGWTTFRANWGSVYGHGTELYLICPDTYASTLRQTVVALEGSPPALRHEDVKLTYE